MENLGRETVVVTLFDRSLAPVICLDGIRSGVDAEESQTI